MVTMMKLSVAIAAIAVLSGTSANAQNVAAPAIAHTTGIATQQPNVPGSVVHNAGATGRPGFGPQRGASMPCADDIKQYCPNVRRGMGRIYACLHDNLAGLKPSCRYRVAGIYDIESRLARAAHEPLDKFLHDAYAQKEMHDAVRAANAKSGETFAPPSPAAAALQSTSGPRPSQH